MSASALLALAALGLGFFLAALGTLIPGLPGAIFVVIGVLIHKFFLPEVLSWWTVIGVVGLAIAAAITDFVAAVGGAKWAGATRFGLIGAALGGFLGIFLGLPGLILGPFVGAILGDIFGHRRDIVALIKSGGGAAMGFLVSFVLRLLLLFASAVLIVLDLLFY